MSPRRLLTLALRALMRSPGRSLLTILGVVIGVSSVVIMVALGHGAQTQIQDRINSLGTNLVAITPGSSTTTGASGGAGSMNSLTLEDVEALERESVLFSAISPVIFTRTMVISQRANWRTSIQGVDSDVQEIRGWTVVSGRFLEPDDIQSARKVCLLGATVASLLYGDDDPVGQTTRLRGVPFEIVGVLGKKGQTADGTDQDDVILAPYTTIRKRLEGMQFLAQILGRAVSQADLPAAMEEARAILRDRHHLSSWEPDDFEVRDQRALAETAGATTRVMTMLLLAIASISLLVGGIGIMNIMLVSVTERTREIGIRRAVGARRGDVLAQFLVESVVLSGFGGVLGALLGVGGSLLVGRITGWAMSVTWDTMLLAFGFSAGVGVFFGWYPARRAAGLDPVEALRQG